MRKILRLLYHVMAHIYHCHFREVALLGLHVHLNCVFAHLTLLNQRFNLIDPKETEILGDLEAALLGIILFSTPPCFSSAALFIGTYVKVIQRLELRKQHRLPRKHRQQRRVPRNFQSQWRSQRLQFLEIRSLLYAFAPLFVSLCSLSN